MTSRPRCLHPQDRFFFTRPSQASAESKDGDKEVNEPIKFSTSKASHRTWKVESSLGSQYERPWWKVLPISLGLTGFLLWCALRAQTDIDVELEKHLFEPPMPSNVTEPRSVPFSFAIRSTLKM
uniref:Ubiquinol-cytochrome c reductase complex assembly factor 4 n=1 Tax=Gasterosteus aculeatus aculeatus TaxID=481459 RepID=A0AAQ4R6Z5_GASAC